jgi:arylsulfatase
MTTAPATPSPLSGSVRSIVLFLADDLGYSDLRCFGGEIATPNIDALASRGTKLTQFYNTARCSPSRASLLTGLHPHQTGIGILTGSDGAVGYAGDLNRAGPTVAEMLKRSGYDTAVIGKWHLSASMREPSDSWPTRRGFDHFYGTLSGCGSFYDPPTLTRGETPTVDEAAAEDYYYTDAIAAEAERYLLEPARQRSPFLLYVPFTAPHWPLHAPADLVARYRGRFDDGWDILREERVRRMRELGILSDATVLSPRDPDEPAWSDVEEKEWFARRMEVYAAQVEAMDAAVGRILSALRAAGREEDTAVVFLSDNGASPEEIPHINGFEQVTEIYSPTTRSGAPVQLGNRPEIVPGPADTYASYGRAWANLSNTPHRLYKKWVHEGGIAAPCVIALPERLEQRAIVRNPHQLVDLVPTLLDVVGVDAKSVRLDTDLPLEGRSLLDELAGASGSERTLYWEHAGNAAIRRGDVKLVRRWPEPWELYHLDRDPSEMHDAIHEEPELAEELLAAWAEWADRVGVVAFDRIVDLFRIRGLGPSDAAR